MKHSAVDFNPIPIMSFEFDEPVVSEADKKTIVNLNYVDNRMNKASESYNIIKSHNLLGIAAKLDLAVNTYLKE